ncbi:MAG TPA: hypothetical protein VGR02_21595 [Thermoanaerobaculia bacterium]|jgi:hypothetical protein|nr:hypothetical protein [Thermoanaerobaculia bacterium]
MIATLRALAERIDSEWRGMGYRPRDLPPIAARLLLETRPDRAFDLSALADWTLTEGDFPQACNPFGPLGPPAFTVWSNPHFFVNVYAYTTPEVVIHDHDFAGAFMNLSGVTIHCTYGFEAADAIGGSVQVGELRLRGIEAISDSAVRQIEPGQGFIHQVWHISRPTVVLVVRTPAFRSDPLTQFQYMRPSIATQVYRNDALSVGFPERFGYTRKMAECLRTSPTMGVDYIKSLVTREQPWDAVWHLIENWRYLREGGALEEVIRLGARHQGAWFAGMESAGSDIDLFYSIGWPRVVAARERIVLALLLSFRSWEPIRKALQGLLPGTEPVEQLLGSLQALAAQQAVPLDLPPRALAALASRLRGEGGDAEGLPQELLLRPLLA